MKKNQVPTPNTERGKWQRFSSFKKIKRQATVLSLIDIKEKNYEYKSPVTRHLTTMIKTLHDYRTKY